MILAISILQPNILYLAVKLTFFSGGTNNIGKCLTNALRDITIYSKGDRLSQACGACMHYSNMTRHNMSDGPSHVIFI